MNMSKDTIQKETKETHSSLQTCTVLYYVIPRRISKHNS